MIFFTEQSNLVNAIEEQRSRQLQQEFQRLSSITWDETDNTEPQNLTIEEQESQDFFSLSETEDESDDDVNVSYFI